MQIIKITDYCLTCLSHSRCIYLIILCVVRYFIFNIPADIYLLKVSNGNTRAIRQQRHHNDDSDFVLVSLLLTLNRFPTFFFWTLTKMSVNGCLETIAFLKSIYTNYNCWKNVKFNAFIVIVDNFVSIKIMHCIWNWRER